MSVQRVDIRVFNIATFVFGNAAPGLVHVAPSCSEREKARMTYERRLRLSRPDGGASVNDRRGLVQLLLLLLKQ